MFRGRFTCAQRWVAMTNLASRRQFLGLASFSVLLGSASLSGCAAGKPELVPSDDHAEDVAAVVLVGDNFYEPESVSIKPGQAVRWEWIGKEQHDVVANDKSFVTELQSAGEYTHIFEDGGEFTYFCSIHPEMRGSVMVE